ncbi:hypothetical protein B9P99_05480 [Candidatus Marsarchaeota G1 archaeon OSP_B]|uniref:Uncharacterized protein n=1 Tax=Candidatus Marsarchaeota G1 archaeon OSP_B TaxID=1978153 RepID=A0A2R6AT06_9ARCH|nr:MAG: hypothetical protein B9P99_05480 [Candidatus Marsarchaeota G1 archaeon OSP_B]
MVRDLRYLYMRMRFEYSMRWVGGKKVYPTGDGVLPKNDGTAWCYSLMGRCVLTGAELKGTNELMSA